MSNTVLEHFFTKDIEIKEFTGIMDRFMFASTMLLLENEDNLYQHDIKDGIHWLHHFNEKLLEASPH